MASRGVNKVILVGNLGNDPDVKYSNGGGNPITRISVATSEQWTDKNTGDKQERTEWHRVVFFGRLAEIAGEYLRKGSKVYIEGRLQTSKYTDQQGIEKYSTDIIASEMQMLDSRGQGMGDAPMVSQGFSQPQQSAQPASGAGFGSGTAAAGVAAGGMQSQQSSQQPTSQPTSNVEIPNSDFDDDVPF